MESQRRSREGVQVFGAEAGQLTEPEHGDGRLGCLLDALLDLVARLAHARLVLLGELCVAPALLRCLRLDVVSFPFVHGCPLRVEHTIVSGLAGRKGERRSGLESQETVQRDARAGCRAVL